MASKLNQFGDPMVNQFGDEIVDAGQPAVATLPSAPAPVAAERPTPIGNTDTIFPPVPTPPPPATPQQILDQGILVAKPSGQEAARTTAFESYQREMSAPNTAQIPKPPTEADSEAVAKATPILDKRIAEIRASWPKPDDALRAILDKDPATRAVWEKEDHAKREAAVQNEIDSMWADPTAYSDPTVRSLEAIGTGLEAAKGQRSPITATAIDVGKGIASTGASLVSGVRETAESVRDLDKGFRNLVGASPTETQRQQTAQFEGTQKVLEDFAAVNAPKTFIGRVAGVAPYIGAGMIPGGQPALATAFFGNGMREIRAKGGSGAAEVIGGAIYAAAAMLPYHRLIKTVKGADQQIAKLAGDKFLDVLAKNPSVPLKEAGISALTFALMTAAQEGTVTLATIGKLDAARAKEIVANAVASMPVGAMVGGLTSIAGMRNAEAAPSERPGGTPPTERTGRVEDFPVAPLRQSQGKPADRVIPTVEQDVTGKTLAEAMGETPATIPPAQSQTPLRTTESTIAPERVSTPPPEKIVDSDWANTRTKLEKLRQEKAAEYDRLHAEDEAVPSAKDAPDVQELATAIEAGDLAEKKSEILSGRPQDALVRIRDERLGRLAEKYPELAGETPITPQEAPQAPQPPAREEIAPEHGIIPAVKPTEGAGRTTPLETTPQAASGKDLAESLRKYDEVENFTGADLANDAQGLAADMDNPRLAKAVEAYRKAEVQDRELAGRGDMDTAETRLVAEVRKAVGKPESKATEADTGAFSRAIEDLKAKQRRGEITVDELGKQVANLGPDGKPKFFEPSPRTATPGTPATAAAKGKEAWEAAENVRKLYQEGTVEDTNHVLNEYVKSGVFTEEQAIAVADAARFGHWENPIVKPARAALAKTGEGKDIPAGATPPTSAERVVAPSAKGSATAEGESATPPQEGRIGSQPDEYSGLNKGELVKLVAGNSFSRKVAARKQTRQELMDTLRERDKWAKEEKRWNQATPAIADHLTRVADEAGKNWVAALKAEAESANLSMPPLATKPETIAQLALKIAQSRPEWKPVETAPSAPEVRQVRQVRPEAKPEATGTLPGVEVPAKVTGAARIKAAKESLAKRLSESRTTPQSAIGPIKDVAGIIKDLAEMAVGYAEIGVEKLKDFIAKVKADFGDQFDDEIIGKAWTASEKDRVANAPKVEPELKDITDQVKAEAGAAEAGGENVTSTKLRITNAEREARGLEPVETAPAETQQGWLDRAESLIAKDPELPKRLIEEALTNPRNLSDVERAVLQIHRVTIRNAVKDAGNRMDAAIEANDRLAKEDAIRSFEDYDQQLRTLEEATKAAGTEWGRAGVAQQIELREDYSLAAMIRKRTAARGEKLPDELIAEIAGQSKQIEALSKQIADRDATDQQRAIDEKIAIEKAKAKAEKPARKLSDKPVRMIDKGFGSKNRIVTNAEAEKLWGELLSSAPRTIYAPLDLLYKTTKLATWAIEGGIRELGEFVKQAKERLGEKFREIEPHVQKAWDDAQKQFAQADRADIADRMKRAAKEGKPLRAMKRQIDKLFESLIADGMHDRDKLVDAVHSVLKEIVPDVTREETMDAISGYGDYKAPSLDEIKIEAAQKKQELQLVAKLRDMEAGQAPARSGVGRQPQTDEARRLQQQVNEAKRKGGYTVLDPETQLKSSLAATETRLRNRIADVRLEIETREKIVREKTDPPTSDKIKELREELDELLAQREEIFGKPGLSDAKKIELATKAAEKSLARIEKQIADGDLFPAKQQRQGPTSPELEAARAKRDAAREHLKELQALADASDPTRKDAIANQAFAARAAQKYADLMERIANGDYDDRPAKRKPNISKENQRAQFELDKLKEVFNKGVFDEKMKRRSKAEKIFGGAGEVLNFSRAVITSYDVSAPGRQGWFALVSHPIMGGKAVGAMFKALWSKGGEHAIMQEIRDRENYPMYKRAGLGITTDTGSIAQMEEAYMSRHASKIPGVGASQRAYTTFLNRMRADLFDSLVKALGRSGEVTSAEAKAIANYVNVTTGRGSLGMQNSGNAVLSTLLFSPRLLASRFQLLLGQPLWRGSWRTRKLIAGEYARILAGMAVVYGIAQLFGADEETDPRSADFGKLRWGDTRLDPLAGLSQVTVLLGREITGETKNPAGKVTPIRGDKVPFGQSNGADLALKFLRTKLAPLVGAGLNVASGKNVVGEKVTLGSTAQDLLVPMTFGDIYDAMKAQGVPAGVALGILGEFGFSMQTYQEKQKKAKATKPASKQFPGPPGMKKPSFKPSFE